MAVFFRTVAFISLFCEFQIERISVGHDGTGKSTQWFLEEVVVYVIDRNERYIFKCNRWIGGKGADLAVGMLFSSYSSIVYITLFLASN